MNFSLYIYYKVAPQVEADVRIAAQKLIEAIKESTGVEGHLLCRRDKPETWMEVYDGVTDPEAFLTRLDLELEKLRFVELLGADSRRMTELSRPDRNPSPHPPDPTD
ncbi:MAG: DUF4936 family protein [Burkholderiales bacterium]